jgi:arsenate reductase
MRGDPIHRKKTVLFICTHNSARSQMAEGFLNALYGSQYRAYSAGTEPSAVNLYAVKVMAEAGIDISKNRSKSVEEFVTMSFDYVVTVCDHAKETCPFFPGGKTYIHKGFEDPSQITGSENENLARVRKIRDEIKEWIHELFGQPH